jgi:oxygen-dependent protoporphyrinogen oxidase
MPQHPTSPKVAVIGGGITGLVAARSLADRGCQVTLFDSAEHLGGQVRTVEVAGHPVDVGAEALHLAGPHVGQLVDQLGLEMIGSAPGSARIWTERGLKRLPAGVGPAGPTRLGPVISSRILSPVGLARAAMEPLVTRGRAAQDDVGVGDFLARRFGAQVTERLVDPVLGSLHAGDVSRLSLRAATPYLAAQLERSRSLLLAQRTRAASGPPSFVSFRRGLGELVEALAADPRIELRPAHEVREVYRSNGGVELRIDGDPSAPSAPRAFDGVVLAVPAHVAAAVLRTSVPASADVLDQLRAASVVTMVAAYPREAVIARPAFAGTGLLFPSTSRRMLKAATFLSTKWPHLQDDDLFLVRMSAGRAGLDHVVRLEHDELVHRLHSDLAVATGLQVRPVEVHVERWPAAIAQLEVGHLDRMTAIRDALATLPGVVLAGAPYEGIGLATCMRSGQQAATSLLERLEAVAVVG